MAAGKKIVLTEQQLRRAAAAIAMNLTDKQLRSRFGIEAKRLKRKVAEWQGRNNKTKGEVQR